MLQLVGDLLYPFWCVMGLKKCKQTADNVYVGSSSSTLSEINSEKSASWGKSSSTFTSKAKIHIF